MKSYLRFVFCLLFLQLSCADSSLKFKPLNQIKDDNLALLWRQFLNSKEGTPSKLGTYKFTDCGGANSAAKFENLIVAPDPIALPGVMNIMAKAVITTALQSPIMTNLTIEKKIADKFIKIPCIGDFGSCIYDDLCDILYSASCPDVLRKIGIDCLCPFKVGTYNLPTSPFDAESLYFPGGDYHIIGNITSAGKPACIDVYLSLKSS